MLSSIKDHFQHVGMLLSVMNIEGKNTESNEEKLKNQSIRNTILSSVSQFDISSERIRQMKQLLSYCIAYTGEGYFGFFKMRLQFGSGCTIIVKRTFGERQKPVSAALVDQSLVFFQKTAALLKNLKKPATL